MAEEPLYWIACDSCLGQKPPRPGCRTCEGRGEYQARRPPGGQQQQLNSAEKEAGLAWASMLKKAHR